MTQLIVIGASATASAIVGSVLVAQALIDDIGTVAGQSVVGLSVIVVSGVLWRWVHRVSDRVEKYWSGALAACQDDNKALRDRVEKLRTDLDKATESHAIERSLRMDFEARLGEADRRHNPRDASS